MVNHFSCRPISSSSHQRCSMKKGVLKNFAKFTRKHLCQSLFINNVAELRPATLLKKRPWHRRFPVNFAKLVRIHFCRPPSLVASPFHATVISSYLHTPLKTSENHQEIAFRPATLLKKRLWHRCFLGNIAKFLRTPFPQNTLLINLKRMEEIIRQALSFYNKVFLITLLHKNVFGWRKSSKIAKPQPKICTPTKASIWGNRGSHSQLFIRATVLRKLDKDFTPKHFFIRMS